jgi:trehalose 6-phosphate synthase
MSRVVVVSNRLPTLRSREALEQPDVPAGGLASAILGALNRVPGSVWLGWSGKVVSPQASDRPTRRRTGGVEFVGIDLTQSEVEGYYLGFCNQALWPLCHCFQSKVAIDVEQEACYRQIQARFARVLLPLLRPGDLLWIHDYHFLLLGAEMRRLGWSGRIGFFLHVPFPPHDLWQILPDPPGFLEAMLAYDVVGFHVRSFLDNYVYSCQRQLNARWDGSTIAIGPRAQKAGAYAIGIEPERFLPSDPGGVPTRGRGDLARVVRGRRLILGVDRLDYTKGIPERLLAYEEFLRRVPEWRKKVSFIQIASPSRTSVPEYEELKARVESLVGRVNAEMAEHDWVPVRYLYRSYSRDRLAQFYREAAVGLVTPLRDGMNLVAKEFVAAQRTVSPGVLVLSRTAGAAEVLPEAVLVNPYLTSDVAQGIARALAMTVEERRERHAALLARVLERTASDWAARFLADLRGGADAPEPPVETGSSKGGVRGGERL